MAEGDLGIKKPKMQGHLDIKIVSQNISIIISSLTDIFVNVKVRSQHFINVLTVVHEVLDHSVSA